VPVEHSAEKGQPSLPDLGSEMASAAACATLGGGSTRPSENGQLLTRAAGSTSTALQHLSGSSRRRRRLGLPCLCGCGCAASAPPCGSCLPTVPGLV
jgi:hypothetical protein